ncbi:hypothetical protein REPUB_Repub05bG0006400 [Reevesia pubescens]
MVFTLFVNNVPPKVHWRWLRRVFQSFGNVVDVFIPRKRNKLGSKMGFVRFESILEARNAQRQLNGAWFLDYRIWVNLAKYNPRRSFWRKTGVFHKEAMVTGAEKVSQLQSMKQNQSFTNDTRRSYSKVKNTEEGYQECTVKGDTTPVNVGLHQIVCMGNSNIEVVSRHVINSDINSVNSIDPLVANKESNENAGANPIVLNLETSIGNTMEIDKESTVVGLEKAILDYDQCEKGLETNVLAGGPGEFVKPANLNEAERDVCLDLDNTDNGPQGMILTTRAEEDVSLMGLGPYVSNVQENADLIVESAPIAESGVDTEREEGDDTEIDNHKVSKKWRCVDDVNKELSRKRFGEGREKAFFEENYYKV